MGRVVNPTHGLWLDARICQIHRNPSGRGAGLSLASSLTLKLD
jgi:hypothetical protein